MLPQNADGDGDGQKNDAMVHHQNDSAGGRLELWCINRGYYALVYVSPAGVRYFIGKCPYDGGRNVGNKTHTDAGVMENITWQSRDGGSDDDGDGKQDVARYFFNVTSGNLTIQHANGSEVREEQRQAKNGTFGVGDLPPKNPHNDSFWASAAGTPTLGGDHGPEGGWALAALVVNARDASAPAPGVAVNVRLSGDILASGTTDDTGAAVFALEPGHTYSVEVAGAAPVSVALTQPTVQNVTLTPPVAAKGFLPGFEGPLVLLAALGVAQVARRRRLR